MDWMWLLLLQQQQQQQAAAAAAAQRDAANRAYITQQYQQFFGRAPDSAGLDYWAGQLNNGYSRDQFSSALTNSTEYQNKLKAEAAAKQKLYDDNRAFVDYSYEQAFGRDPDAAGWDYWTNALVNGTSRDYFTNSLYNSAEYKNAQKAKQDAEAKRQADLLAAQQAAAAEQKRQYDEMLRQQAAQAAALKAQQDAQLKAQEDFQAKYAAEKTKSETATPLNPTSTTVAGPGTTATPGVQGSGSPVYNGISGSPVQAGQTNVNGQTTASSNNATSTPGAPNQNAGLQSTPGYLGDAPPPFFQAAQGTPGGYIGANNRSVGQTGKGYVSEYQNGEPWGGPSNLAAMFGNSVSGGANKMRSPAFNMFS